MEISETELKELCQEWKRRLGLEHWRTEIKFVRGVEIGNNCAQCDFSFVNETALIRVKAYEDYHGYFPCDIEATIVHELLHILLDTASSGDSILYEQSIDRLARTLVGIKRENKAR